MNTTQLKSAALSNSFDKYVEQGKINPSNVTLVKEFKVFTDPDLNSIPSSNQAFKAEMKNEAKLEYKHTDWSKEYKKIDMFAVKLNEQGGFNVKSFNSVSKV